MFENCRTIEDIKEVRTMEKECCNINVTETEEGYRIDLKGENLKEKFETMVKSCCGEEMKKKGVQFCCGTGK